MYVIAKKTIEIDGITKGQKYLIVKTKHISEHTIMVINDDGVHVRQMRKNCTIIVD